MKNKIFLFLMMIFLLYILQPIHAYAAEKESNIKNFNISIDKDGNIEVSGRTQNVEDGNIILVKVFNEEKGLEFFEQIKIYNNRFQFDFVPMNAQLKDKLKMSIVGIVEYEEEFYYEEIHLNKEEIVINETTALLKEYMSYYDNDINVKLKFTPEIAYNGSVVFVYLNGTNFTKNDTCWTNKDIDAWESYLKTLTTKCYEVVEEGEVFIYVYDRDKNFIQYYPRKASGALLPIFDSNNDGLPDDNILEGSLITDSSLHNILGKDFDGFTFNDYNYYFGYTITDATETLIKLDITAYFSVLDECWEYKNLKSFEEYFQGLANRINLFYNADLDFSIYDVNGIKILDYNYYTYKAPDISGSSLPKNTYFMGIVDENYIPEKELIETDVKDYYDYNEDYQFVPFDKNNKFTAVLSLKLANIGINSKEIKPVITKEGMFDGNYLYELTLDHYEIVDALNDLRHDNQKIIYMKQQLDSNNMVLTIPNHIYSELAVRKALFVINTDYFKLELDFSKFMYTGTSDLVINVKEVPMDERSLSKNLDLSIMLSGEDAVYYFGNPIKCLVHYDSDRTKDVEDLRCVSVMTDRDVFYNATASTKEKGFIFNYVGTHTYYLYNNGFYFEDIEDPNERKVAQLISAKEIINPINEITFNPEGNVSRGDFIYMLAYMMGAFNEGDYFEDIDYMNPYYFAINGLYDLNILPGSWKKNLELDKNVTIEEAVYMIVRCYEERNPEAKLTSASLLFKDKQDISVWAKNKIGIGAKIGIIEDDGELYPQEDVYRIEIAQMLYNLFKLEGIF